MIKVVVVDDSAFMRKAISTMLDKDPQIEVVGVARNGEEGLELIRRHQPDVVTLDIEMPVMDGLTTLRHIMMEMPRPVIMISSLTTEGAEATLKAMELGAVDFIPKELSKVSLDIVKIEESLQNKVKGVARRRLRLPGKTLKERLAQTRESREPREPLATRGPASGQAPATRQPPGEVRMAQRPTGKQVRDVVAIGVSTGGPPAVQRLLSGLPGDFPASILIAQHMPPAFTGPFAKRLDGVTALSVKEAEGGERLTPGMVYVSPGGKHLTIDQKVSRIDVVVSPDPAEALYKPSADVLLGSVAEQVGRRGLGVIMTGMGSDGSKGAKRLKEQGGRLIAQNDASCVVYGMPKAVVEAGLADVVVDLEDLAEAVYQNLYL